MARTSLLLLAMLLGCASTQRRDQTPRAEEISSCWTKYGDWVLEQTRAALAQRKCEQECEAAGESGELPEDETNEPERKCERECEAPSETEEIEIASAVWLQTSQECRDHAHVLARRTRAERQQAEIANHQQDWSSAPPIERSYPSLPASNYDYGGYGGGPNCSKGKRCGNSCISWDKDCHK